MKYEELEHIYNHWHKEYLFFKDNSIGGIILIVSTYLTYLYCFINNSCIQLGYFMYAICIYSVLWTIADLFVLKKIIEKRDEADNELLKWFERSDEDGTSN